jgi:GSH-dependent disulfide-bond oxidoreductase
VDKFTLYHWEPNANPGKPMLALNEKGVQFESVYVDLQKFEHHSPEYLAINPLGVIPAAVHGNLRLYESSAIMEYIDAAFDGPLLRPADPAARWRMRWWIKYCDETYAPAISMTAWSTGRLVAGIAGQSDAEIQKRLSAIPQKERQTAWSKAIYGSFSKEEMAESVRKVTYGATLIECALQQNEWLAGPTYSLADIAAFCHCYMLPLRDHSPINVDATPRTMQWLRAIAVRPATVATWKLGRMWNLDRIAHLRQPEAERG